MPEQQTAVGSTKSLRFFTSSHSFSMRHFPMFFATYVAKNSYYFKTFSSTPIPMKTHILIYHLSYNSSSCRTSSESKMCPEEE